MTEGNKPRLKKLPTRPSWYWYRTFDGIEEPRQVWAEIWGDGKRHLVFKTRFHTNPIGVEMSDGVWGPRIPGWKKLSSDNPTNLSSDNRTKEGSDD